LEFHGYTSYFRKSRQRRRVSRSRSNNPYRTVLSFAHTQIVEMLAYIQAFAPCCRHRSTENSSQKSKSRSSAMAYSWTTHDALSVQSCLDLCIKSSLTEVVEGLPPVQKRRTYQPYHVQVSSLWQISCCCKSSQHYPVSRY
jgi:hypothetical protein